MKEVGLSGFFVCVVDGFMKIVLKMLSKIKISSSKVVFPDIVDVECYSHMIDLVGEKFDTPILDEFITL